MNKTKQRNRQEFAEDFGILFESMGFPCMAGRIWGWLLTSDPPHQTAAEIAEGVGASRGSISTMTAHLMQNDKNIPFLPPYIIIKPVQHADIPTFWIAYRVDIAFFIALVLDPFGNAFGAGVIISPQDIDARFVKSIEDVFCGLGIVDIEALPTIDRKHAG